LRDKEYKYDYKYNFETLGPVSQFSGTKKTLNPEAADRRPVDYIKNKCFIIFPQRHYIHVQLKLFPHPHPNPEPLYYRACCAAASASVTSRSSCSRRSRFSCLSFSALSLDSFSRTTRSLFSASQAWTRAWYSPRSADSAVARLRAASADARS